MDDQGLRPFCLHKINCGSFVAEVLRYEAAEVQIVSRDVVYEQL